MNCNHVRKSILQNVFSVWNIGIPMHTESLLIYRIWKFLSSYLNSMLNCVSFTQHFDVITGTNKNNKKYTEVLGRDVIASAVKRL